MADACSDENELMELADGLLPASRRARIMRHVDACGECRAVLAELARAGSVSESADTPRGVAPERRLLPAELLREYSKREAPARELRAARFVAWSMVVLISFVLLRALLGHRLRFSLGVVGVMAALLGYELLCIHGLRRGWFHPRLPLVSSLVEVSIFLAVQVVIASTLGGFSYLAFPGAILLGVLIAFSAQRADPNLCLVVGGAAAIEVFIIGLLGPRIPSAPGPMLGVHVIRAVFCLVGGFAGMSLARDMIARAEAALREIREQDLFGKYLVHERLGRGGMGEVFRATYCPEGGFVRTVAVKSLRPELSQSPKFMESFRKEAQLGSTLVHPNIVQMLDCGRFRGGFMVAMEFVDGASLAAVLERHLEPLPLSAVTYLGAELAAALEYLHGKRSSDGEPLGLVHCDLNPPNVLLSRIGEVKLADFGVARAGVARAGVARAGGAGADDEVRFAGKVAYAAPEQIQGRPMDGRADLFALGLTLYEALTRRHPKRGDAVPSPSTVRSDIPPALDALVMELLAQAPEERPPLASQVRARLLAMGGAGAPYPYGGTLLARSVESALQRRSS
ncbi:protein kinase domain-containing protein [Pendulispora albinea]|uniref:Protein kinase n=1 Tax=Pendulispora albinea TaxID=2741071 RepID=A0ABZ2LVH0_9BACT